MLRSILLAGLFSQGLLSGWLYLSLSRTHDLPPAIPAEIVLSTPDAPSSADVYTPQQYRQLAEQLLRGDNPGQAIPHLLNAAPSRLEEADDDLLWRIALCYEAAEDYSRAARWYDLVANRSSRALLIQACRYGLARCRMHSGEQEAARQLLWRYYLTFRHEDPGQLNTEGLLLLAHSFGDTQPADAHGLMRRGLMIESGRPPLNVDRQLQLVTDLEKANIDTRAVMGEQDAQVPAAVTIDDVMRTGSGPDNLIASFDARQVTLLFLFQCLSSKLQIPVEMTDQARERAEQERISLMMDHVNLSAALDAQTLPFELGWSWRDDAIVIYVLQEAPQEIQQGLHDQAALRILQRVLMLAPDHKHAAWLRFFLANLQYRLGQRALAMAVQRDLLNGQLDPRLRQAVNFNLGQLYLLANDAVSAVGPFSRVVDSNTSGLVQSVGWIKLGQIHAELGQIPQAVAAFSRASRTSEDGNVRQLAAIGLVAAYLLDGQYRLAGRTVTESQPLLIDPQLRQVSKYLAALSSAGRQHESLEESQQMELLEGLSQWQWNSDHGKYGHFLAARGYEYLGFHDYAIEYSMRSLAESPAPWLYGQNLQQLSRLLIKQHHFGQARAVLHSALQNPDFQGRAMALGTLAQIEFQSDHHEQCLDYCRQLLAGDAAPDQYAEALKLMGKIYEQRGEHYQAALCFAGLLPELMQPVDTGQPQENADVVQ